MVDPVEFGKQMAAIVREATAPLLARIAELEKSLAGIVIPDVEQVARAAADMIPAPAEMEPVTVESLRPVIEAAVDDAVKSIPTPEVGKEEAMGELKAHLADLVKHVQLPTPPSVDEVAAVFERRFSDLTLSWERQARDTFEKAADRIPVPKDGKDALPLESFDLSLGDDDRTVTVKMQAGETVVEKSIRLATVLDRGQFKAGEAYERGDGVSHGSSFWIAQKDNPDGVPGMGKSDWRLAVKKGRDGKDLRDNSSTVDTSKGVSIK